MRYLLLLLSFFMLTSCNSKDNLKDAFIMTWDTRNKGYGDSTEIIVPLRGKYAIEWYEVGNKENKGKVKECDDNTLITFPKAGIYQLIVSGDIATMNFETYTIDTIPKYGKKDYKFISVEQWGNTIWKSFDSFFYKCCSIEIVAKDTPDLSQVSTFRQAFCNARNFNSSLDNWDMNNVKDMSYMFYDAWKFNQSLNSWDVRNLQNTHSMFGYAKIFNQPLDKWDVSSVFKMSGMFNHAYKFNHPIENWNVSNVTRMGGMFDGASSFNQPLEKWDVSSVADMVNMFMNADSFNQPLNNWDMSSISGSAIISTFWGADSFNQPLDKWDVSKVTNIKTTFYQAKSFNQSLTEWEISEDCEISETLYDDTKRGIFTQTSMTEENITKTLRSWNKMSLINLFLDQEE
ncbi:BspA family leucine-rich repeat surface protein [Psychroserpens sp. NJDZ02]|nr:BspA family leucine-rich repeat surface protein [Psychroserpens sp. NJDZ02]